MLTSYKDFTQAYPQIIRDVLEKGAESAPRGQPIKELIGYSFKLDSYEQPFPLQKSRKLNYRFCLLEGLCLVANKYPPRVILHFNKNLSNFMNPNTGTWDGRYPPRVHDTLLEIVQELRRDKDSRRAVVAIYDRDDVQRYGEQTYYPDIPCTMYLQFLIRDNKLHMIANMRSNDILWGLGNDVVQFAILGQAVAAWLGIQTGSYTHHAGSMHSYNERESQVRDILNGALNGTEVYNTFSFPVWKHAYHDSKEELDILFHKLEFWVNSGEHDPFARPLVEPFNTYYDILTGKIKIT